MLLALTVLLFQLSPAPVQDVTNLPFQSTNYSSTILAELLPQSVFHVNSEANGFAPQRTTSTETVFPQGSALATASDAEQPDVESNSFLPGQTELTPVTASGESSSRPASEPLAGRISSNGRSASYRRPAEPAGRGMPLMWYILGAGEHGAATFDAWSTRRVIQSGMGQEMNPMLRPFANSGALYGAVQVAPLLFDMLSKHMYHSSHAWERKIWWLPQTASMVASFVGGAHNLNIH